MKLNFKKEKPYFSCEQIKINKNSIIFDFNNDLKEYILINKIILIICLVYHCIILIVKKESIVGYIFILLIYLFCAPFFLYLQIIPYSHSSLEEKRKSEREIIKLDKIEFKDDNASLNNLTKKTMELDDKKNKKNKYQKF